MLRGGESVANNSARWKKPCIFSHDHFSKHLEQCWSAQWGAALASLEGKGCAEIAKGIKLRVSEDVSEDLASSWMPVQEHIAPFYLEAHKVLWPSPKLKEALKPQLFITSPNNIFVQVLASAQCFLCKFMSTSRSELVTC